MDRPLVVGARRHSGSIDLSQETVTMEHPARNPTPTRSPSSCPSRRTGMSFQRTRMSADRTLMSVIRTSLSLICFGFTIFQVFEKLRDAGN